MTTPEFMVRGAATAFTGPGGRGVSCIVELNNGGGANDIAKILIDDRDGTLAIPSIGSTIGVSMGYHETSLFNMGVYTIKDVVLSGWPRSMLVEATGTDEVANPIKQGRTYMHHNATVQDIMHTIAARSGGLAVSVSPELANIQFKSVEQKGESDQALGTRLGNKLDAMFKVANGTLLFIKQGTGMSGSGVILAGAEAIFPINVKKYQCKLLGRNVNSTASANWFAPKEAEAQSETAPSTPPLPVANPARTDRLAAAGAPAANGQTEAQDAAKGQADATGRATGKLTITIIGTPTVMAGSFLMVQGVRADVDGEWSMTKVTHVIDDRGYETHIEAEYPGTGASTGAVDWQAAQDSATGAAAVSDYSAPTTATQPQTTTFTESSVPGQPGTVVNPQG
jgi:Bacteriophage probable baseplate hub protein